MSVYSCVTLIMLNSFLEVCDLHDTVMEILYVSMCAYVSLQVSLGKQVFPIFVCGCTCEHTCTCAYRHIDVHTRAYL